MEEILLGVLEFLGLAWWVEVVTDTPRCTYYFGPFVDAKEAQSAQSGYIEDLEQEGAKVIRVTVKRFKPSKLTIVAEEDEEVEAVRSRIFPVLSGQL